MKQPFNTLKLKLHNKRKHVAHHSPHATFFLSNSKITRQMAWLSDLNDIIEM